MTQYERNILKWAALLHDISKRCEPHFKGKDHIHPFNSGLATLYIFRYLGFIKIEDQDQEELFQ